MLQHKNENIRKKKNDENGFVITNRQKEKINK